MKKDILICGVGGQGTVLASKVIAAAAGADGSTVHSAETIGMAQRGGPVTSHVRIGDDVFSPLIPLGGAGLIIGFEPAEVVRNIGYLAEGGLAVVNTAPVRPATGSASGGGYDVSGMMEYLAKNANCIFADGVKECEKLDAPRSLNIFLLGIAAGSGQLGISKETLSAEMEKRVPEKYREANLKAFNAGFETGRSRS